MRKVSALAILLNFLWCGAGAANDDAFTVLYEDGPWTVFKFTNSSPGDTPNYCSARSALAGGYLEILATKEAGCLSAEDPSWTFDEHTGEVGFLVSGGGVYIDNGNYYPNGLQVCAENAATDALIDTIWSMTGDAIDVFNDEHLKVGSFPFYGRGPALEAWKSCRDGL